jgi:hypothetical protein
MTRPDTNTSSDDKITHIDDHRKHCTASVECVACGKKWVAVFPVETKQLECPQCNKLDGVYL